MSSKSKGKSQKAKVQFKIQNFQKEVWEYWKENGRHDLPWRRTHDPYAILVSEIMLQQTQVDRVIPYFKRWMKRFPTVRRLTESSLAEVLQEWSGLGYNRRAKMLRECAKVIMQKHGGRVPKDAIALRALPGVGAYTAGAVRVFAFNRPDIIVETNIRAALIYHFLPRSTNVSDTTLMPMLQKAIARAESPREWYAALMDYGSYLKKQTSNPSRRSAHHVRQSRFEGSSRQIRGKIVRALLTGSLRTSILLKGVHASTGISVLAALKREGMIVRKGSRWELAGSGDSR